MIFPGLDCLFCNVVTVVVRGEGLIGHSCCRNFVVVGLINFIVEDLMLWDEALGLHVGKKLPAGGYWFAGSSNFYCFDPGGVSVNVYSHHLVVVVVAGALWKLPGLICEHRFLGVVEVN